LLTHYTKGTISL